jgi:hypothetical protein
MIAGIRASNPRQRPGTRACQKICFSGNDPMRAWRNLFLMVASACRTPVALAFFERRARRRLPAEAVVREVSNN